MTRNGFSVRPAPAADATERVPNSGGRCRLGRRKAEENQRTRTRSTERDRARSPLQLSSPRSRRWIGHRLYRLRKWEFRTEAVWKRLVEL